MTVFDSGVDGTTPFIVMELAVGQTLRQVLDETGMLAAGDAVRIAAAVCEALEVAHAAGLVHRDITPANIVLADGEVKVLDFGIARADGGTGITGTAVVLGTAAYLSPEQALGRPAGPQADLYSLGCVLFEMLTGAPPFSADSAVGLAYRHVHDDPGPPSARRPGLPARLDQITARLLAKDPVAAPPAPLPLGPGCRRPGPGRHRAADAPDRRPGARVGPPRAVAPAPGRGCARRGIGRITGRPGRGAPGPPATHAGLPLAGAPGRHPPGAHAATRTPHTASQAGRGTPAGQHVAPGRGPAAAFTGDLQAAVTDGQVTTQAGHDLFGHLQQLLFGPPGQNAQQIQQQYQQLVQAYDQHQSQDRSPGRQPPGCARRCKTSAPLSAPSSPLPYGQAGGPPPCSFATRR